VAAEQPDDGILLVGGSVKHAVPRSETRSLLGGRGAARGPAKLGVVVQAAAYGAARDGDTLAPGPWHAQPMRRVAITGMGAVTPLGIGVAALWEGWIAGHVALEGGAGRCDAFDRGSAVSARDAHRLDRFSQLAIVAAAEAIEQAALGEGPYAAERTGCVVGTGIGGTSTIEAEAAAVATGGRAVSPLTIPRAMGNAAGAQIAMRHGLRGPAFTPVSACAAGAHAIGLAARMIRHDEADAVVCGGSEAPLTDVIGPAMAAMGAASPTGRCLPFDARRDGCVVAEGAGILVLEEAGMAAARGASILGEVLGFGQTNDARHLTAPEPDGSAAAAAMAAALRDGGLEPEDVDYVNAHGTATPLNDLAETRAIKRALGERAGAVPVSSLKSAIGHLIGAAGAVEAIATIRALRERVAPPTLSLDEPDPELDLDYVPNEARALGVSRGRPVALSNAFGFGGHNAVLALAA